MADNEAPRVVSLIASATEIVCALGLREQLVGVSHECDYPPGVESLRVLSRPKLDPKRPSGEIDRRVRELVRDGLSVYEVDVDGLEKLRPDVIVTQDHCEVCAVSLADVEAATCSLTLRDTRICSLHPDSLDQVCRDFEKVAAATGVPERGAALVASFRARLEAVRAAVSARVGAGARPRVACIEWLTPPMLAAGWMAELVQIAGGEPVVVESDRSFSTVTWEDLADLDPDIAVVMPCGFGLDQTLADLAGEAGDGLRTLRAVSEGRCFVADGNAYFNRPGPRLAESAEILAALCHPEHAAKWLEQHAAAFAAWS